MIKGRRRATLPLALGLTVLSALACVRAEGEGPRPTGSDPTVRDVAAPPSSSGHGVSAAVRADGDVFSESPTPPEPRSPSLPPLCSASKASATVHVTPDQVTLFGSEMSVSRTPGFQPGKHVRSTAPSLQECLALARPEKIDVRAEASCTSFQLHAVLQDLRRAGMDAYELWVGGVRVGRFAFLSETPDCEVSDMYLGPATETRMSHGHLAATTGRVAASRVVLVCDLGTDLGRLVPVLRKLDGKHLRIALHTGGY